MMHTAQHCSWFYYISVCLCHALWTCMACEFAMCG